MDEQGKLSEEEMNAIFSGLSEKLLSGCWNCSAQDWRILPFVVGENFYDAQGQFLTSASFAPKIRLTCNNCGNIVYFDAKAMGLDVEGRE